MKQVVQKQTGDTLTADEYSLCTSLECQNIVTNTGQALTDANLEQLNQAVSRIGSRATAYVDVTGGPGNNYIINSLSDFTNSALTTLFSGMTLIFSVQNGNTGPATLNVDGLGAIPLLDINASPLVGGELAVGAVNYIKYFSGNFILSPFNAVDIAFQQQLSSQITSSEGATLVGTTGETVQEWIENVNTTLSPVFYGGISGSSIIEPASYNLGFSARNANETVVTFTNALPNSNYSVVVTLNDATALFLSIANRTPTNFTVFAYAPAGGSVNFDIDFHIIGFLNSA